MTQNRPESVVAVSGDVGGLRVEGAAWWLAVLCIFAGAGLVLWMALQPPWLGVTLAAVDGQVEISGVAADGPSAGKLTPGMCILRVNGVPLNPRDLMEEPDGFDRYQDMAAFFARQDQLAQVLQGAVTLHVQAGLQLRDVVIQPGVRPLANLPAVFWVQLASGALACGLGLWSFKRQTQNWGARMFALGGSAFPLSAWSAALYSTRELALPGPLFTALSVANHAGATLFSIGLVGLFMVYPQRLVRPSALWALPCIFVPWWLADSLQWAVDQNWGARLPIGILAALLFGFAGWQWRQSRAHPLNRAALRWMLLSAVVGFALFALATVANRFLGELPSLSQGYMFGFMVLVYAGMGLGVWRYRLFALDGWLFRAAYWVGGALTALVVPILFVPHFSLEHPASVFALITLSSGWLYFPARQWLWQRFVHHRPMATEKLLPQLIEIAFTPTSAQKAVYWDAVLHQLYAPEQITVQPNAAAPSTAAPMQSRVEEEGQALWVPAVAGLPPRLLHRPLHGRALFAPQETVFMDTLLQLMQHVADSHAAHERGAAEERRRIARDMHDDISARLLMLIHRAATPRDAEIARAAMQDLRTALNALDAQPVPLNEALADWHAELRTRCQAAGVALVYRDAEVVGLIGAHEKSTLERVLREAVTNALKHATPTQITVQARCENRIVHVQIENDDCGDAPSADPATWVAGRGMRSMRKRLEEHGGALEIGPMPGKGACVAVTLPLA